MRVGCAGVWGKAVQEVGADSVEIAPKLLGVGTGLVKGLVEELGAGLVIDGDVTSLVVKDPVGVEQLGQGDGLHADVLTGPVLRMLRS
jgi:hypothetical protein